MCLTIKKCCEFKVFVRKKTKFDFFQVRLAGLSHLRHTGGLGSFFYGLLGQEANLVAGIEFRLQTM